MPTTVRRDDRVSLLRPPTAAFVGANAVMILEDRIDNCPRGLNRVFAREKGAVTSHGVAEQPLVGRFVARPNFRKVKLSLLSDEILARELHARGNSYGRVGRKPKAKVVGSTRLRR
jgi:hypothetical protein